MSNHHEPTITNVSNHILQGSSTEDRAAANFNTSNGMNSNEYMLENSTTRNYHTGNPLAHQYTGDSALFPPFAGYLQPGAYRAPDTKIGNPVPLGLSAFALTTFILSLINVQARSLTQPGIVISLAFGYGGLVQILAGMWEMAIGNTFGATALTSYGGFWISLAIILTPNGFGIVEAYSATNNGFDQAFGLFLMGWCIFTFILLLCTLRSTVVFFSLFFSAFLTFLFLSVAYLLTPDVTGGLPDISFQKAGGYTGFIATACAWYIAFAGIADDSNSFFTVPVWHFPWSVEGRERKEKSTRSKV